MKNSPSTCPTPVLEILQRGAPVNGLPRRSGFSLVEVVMALGIMSFALMGIVGLLPAGLSQFREAIDITVQSQIAQELVSELQRTDYTAIQSGSYFYDSEGGNLPGPDDAQFTYTATISVLGDGERDRLIAPTWTDPQGGPALSGVKAVTISISSRRNSGAPHKITTYVANTGSSTGI
jgi:uncharacterized protein (TIGR02598 family)